VLAPCSAVTRRTVTGADTPLLRELFADARDDLLLLPADVRDALVDMQFRAQRRQYAETYPQARHEVLVVDGRDVGRLLVDYGAATVRVVDVTIRHAHRGRGIATIALTEVLAAAERADQPVQLSVWSTNAVARRVYERLGFELTGESAGYLELRRCVPEGRAG
jgi:ribosomal protein S18 acetylase RimI-like enzyme